MTRNTAVGLWKWLHPTVANNVRAGGWSDYAATGVCSHSPERIWEALIRDTPQSRGGAGSRTLMGLPAAGMASTHAGELTEEADLEFESFVCFCVGVIVMH